MYNSFLLHNCMSLCVGLLHYTFASHCILYLNNMQKKSYFLTEVFLDVFLIAE